jgi:hypothetical protein
VALTFEDALTICRIPEQDPRTSREEAQANAYLIAAAPELLEACRNVALQFEAIKKRQHELLVEGQTLESAAANWDEATLGQSIDFEPLIAAIAKAEGRS